MNMRKKIISVLSIAAIGITVLANAQETDPFEEAANEPFDLERITCWEVNTLPDEDTGYVLVMLYGYSAGKQNKSEQTGQEIADTIINAGETCSENPDMAAYEAFVSGS